MSLVFVVSGLLEFAIVIMMNRRSSSGTQDRQKTAKNQKMRIGGYLKKGTPDQKSRFLNQVLSIRNAMNMESNGNTEVKTDEEKIPPEKVGKKMFGHLHAVDIIACSLFLFAYVGFNVGYFFHYLSSNDISCIKEV